MGPLDDERRSPNRLRGLWVVQDIFHRRSNANGIVSLHQGQDVLLVGLGLPLFVKYAGPLEERAKRAVGLAPMPARSDGGLHTLHRLDKLRVGLDAVGAVQPV